MENEDQSAWVEALGVDLTRLVQYRADLNTRFMAALDRACPPDEATLSGHEPEDL